MHWLVRSEAEGEHLSAASGVTINEGAEADLMEDSLACKTFGNHPDHKSDHGCTTVKKFNFLELIFMNGACCFVLEPGFVSGSAIHDGLLIETNCNRGLTLGHLAAMAFSISPAVFASGTARGTLGKQFHRIHERCRTRVHKK
jgi:hypothetical protein